MNNQKSLIFKLYVPLIVLAIGATIFTWFYSGQIDVGSFLLNLSTEVLGIIITVWYVDKIISSHNQAQWRITNQLIEKRIKTILDGILTVFSFTYGALEAIENKFTLHDRVHKFDVVIDFVREHAISLKNDKDLPKKILLLSLTDIHEFGETILKNQAEISNLIDMFGARISPNQMESLISIQDALKNIESRLPSLNLQFKKEIHNTEIKRITAEAVAELIQHCIGEIEELQNILRPDE